MTEKEVESVFEEQSGKKTKRKPERLRDDEEEESGDSEPKEKTAQF